MKRIIVAILLITCSSAFSQDKPKSVSLTLNEGRILFTLIENTNVKGSEIDFVSDLKGELRVAFETAVSRKDTLFTISFSKQRENFCLKAINGGVFLAKYSEQIGSLRKKLEPPKETSAKKN